MAKLTAGLETHLDDEMAEDFRRHCRIAGCKPSELIRDLICDVLHGVTYGEHIAQSRRLAITRPAASERQDSGDWPRSVCYRTGNTGGSA